MRLSLPNPGDLITFGFSGNVADFIPGDVYMLQCLERESNEKNHKIKCYALTDVPALERAIAYFYGPSAFVQSIAGILRIHEKGSKIFNFVIQKKRYASFVSFFGMQIHRRSK